MNTEINTGEFFITYYNHKASRYVVDRATSLYVAKKTAKAFVAEYSLMWPDLPSLDYTIDRRIFNSLDGG